MPVRDHIEIPPGQFGATGGITDFDGLFDRGSKDVCPPLNFSDCLNIAYRHNEAGARKGTDLAQAFGPVRRIFRYKRTGEATRRLILDNAGRIYDSTSPAVPILTIVGMTDFSCAVFLGRAYITPHNGDTGLVAESVYVYDGTTCRKAAGLRPAGTLVAANSVTAGHVDAGTHLFAVAFETDTGFITKPGPTIFAQLNATGGFKVDLSGIPTGSSSVLNRRILATRRIANYDGNQNAAEFFFVPTGVISGNVATTATIDFFDSDLIQSADYLFDQLETIPAGVFIDVYRSRLVVGGSQTDPTLCYFSKSGDPESIDSVDGLVVFGPGESDGVQNGVEFRDNFYVTKSDRTWMVNDVSTPDTPASWIPVVVDRGIGSAPFGIAALLDKRGANVDRFIVASRAGLQNFDGTYSVPELSYNIAGIWERINTSHFNLVQSAVDSIHKMIYVAVPLDMATDISHLIVGNYQDGLSYDKIRWSIYQYGSFTPSCLMINLDNNKDPILELGSLAGNIYQESKTNLSDAGTSFEIMMRFPPLALDTSGAIIHIAGIRLRAYGAGLLHMDLYSEDDAYSSSMGTLTLSASPGREYFVPANFESEKASLRLRVSNFGEWFNVIKVALYAATSWTERVAD